MPCSNAAKTQKPLKFVGVPQTPEPISAVSGLTFTILSGHVEEVLLLKKFFPIVDTCLSCEDMAQQICATSNLRLLRLGEEKEEEEERKKKKEETG